MSYLARISLERSAQASKASSSERTRVLSQSKRISVIWRGGLVRSGSRKKEEGRRKVRVGWNLRHDGGSTEVRLV